MTTRNNDCMVDFIQEKIIVTKRFVKAASIINSTEYNAMIQLRRDNPTFPVEIREIKKKEGKKSYRNLNYDNMKAYIIAKEGEKSPMLSELEKVKKLSKVQAGPYAYVKKWFLNTYPDYKETEADKSAEENKVVSIAKS